MKTLITSLMILTSPAAFAFEYPSLLPTGPMTLAEAKEITSRVEQERENANTVMNGITAEKQTKLDGWVEYKKRIIVTAREAIDMCKKEPACVANENTKLNNQIKETHEKIREINEYYDKKILAEKQIVDKKVGDLTKVLFALRAAVIANVIQEKLASLDGKEGFSLETNLQLEILTNHEETNKWMHSNFGSVGWYTILSSSYASRAMGTFYFRTPAKQTKIHLYFQSLRYDFEYNQNTYSEMLNQIRIEKELVAEVFGLNKSQLVIEILKSTHGDYSSYMPCLGHTDKAKACVGVMKNDSVALQ